MSLAIFSTIVGTTSFAAAAILQPRTVETQATCQSSFTWMDNAEHNSPCEVTAQLNALCNNNQWIVPAVNASQSYDVPSTSARTVSLCTCSWASYNLISACTSCQGFPEKIPSWSAYSQNCAGNTSTTYFPPSIFLPIGVTIPFWAGQDPTTWTNQIFDTAAAQSVASEDHADLGSTKPTPHKKSSNVGPIVGGVIGGLAVIAIASALAFYILRRARKPVSPSPALSIIGEKGHHARSMSDLTTSTGMQGYTTLSSTPMNPPTSPTVLTHQSSIRSFPYFSSMVASTVPQGTSSPPPFPTTTPPPRNREDVVEPFTLPPSNVTDRKQPNGAYPIYDPPTAPPPTVIPNMEISRPATPSQRTRYNPPTYSESTTGGASTSGSRPLHRGKQGSTDTLPSITSSRTHGRATPAHSPNPSASGTGNIIGQMGVVNPNSAAAPTHGRQVSGSRDEKRQPTEDSVSARDLA